MEGIWLLGIVGVIFAAWYRAELVITPETTWIAPPKPPRRYVASWPDTAALIVGWVMCVLVLVLFINPIHASHLDGLFVWSLAIGAIVVPAFVSWVIFHLIRGGGFGH
jgi:hypothetical protein